MVVTIGGGGDYWWWSLTGLPMWFWHRPKDLIFYQCLPISFILWYIIISSWSKVIAPCISGHSFFLLSLMNTRTIFVLLGINLPNLAVSHMVGTLTFLLWMVRMTASFGFGKKVVSKAIKEVMLLWFGRKDNYGLGRGKGKGGNNLYLERLIFWNPGWPRVLNYISLGLRSF